jgi:mannose-6-phosphate isomerase
MDLYPYKFEPIYQERIWGGKNLARIFGRSLPADKVIGESWELADLKEGTTVVANGPLAGKTLTDLTREQGPALMGEARPAEHGRFPLLLKYLDAEQTLSLQVHPDAEAAKRLGGGAVPKTECWYVLESRGGFLYKGLKPGVSRKDFEAALKENRAEDVVRRYEVKAGDFHYLPAGTVHALGAGTVVAEIQTPSDTTFRVTDWGRGRQTHLREAMECIRFEEASDAPPGAEGEVLVWTKHFAVTRQIGTRQTPLSFSDNRCLAIMLLRGSMTLVHPEPNPERIDPLTAMKAGQTVLLPAGLTFVDAEPLEDVRLLRITLPGTDR